MISSRMLAQRTGKDHFHVMRDIRAIMKRKGITPSTGTYPGNNGENRPEIHVPDDLAKEYMQKSRNPVSDSKDCRSELITAIKDCLASM